MTLAGVYRSASGLTDEAADRLRHRASPLRRKARQGVRLLGRQAELESLRLAARGQAVPTPSVLRCHVTSVRRHSTHALTCRQLKIMMVDMNTSNTVIAKALTFDGKRVNLWSDGVVTFAFSGITGVGAARDPAKVTANLRAGWWIMGDACLYTSEEIGAVITAARKLAARDPSANPGDFRAFVEKALNPEYVVRPVWTTIEADRDGNPRVQCWRLPRIFWPGLAIWRDGAVYSIWCEVGRTGTFGPTGVTFRNLRELTAHLETIKAVA